MRNLITVFLAVMLTMTVTAKDKEGDAPADSDNTATVALSGTVYDSDSGEFLVGVEITLDKSGKKTYTDLDGNFTFKNIKPGEYQLVSNYISYEKATEVINLDTKNNEVKIKMETSK